jgi:hypothetical protein
MHAKPVYLLLPLVLLMHHTAIARDDPEDWLDQEDDNRTLLVNEGHLKFHSGTPNHRVLQTRNWLTVTPGSLQTGWVALHQCQRNLDPVAAVEIVYRYEGLRNLRVISSRRIEHTRVEQNSIQMEQVQEGGEVCIEAEVQVLKIDGEGNYSLQSGPFHRRFLDGYYPVQLDYRIRWPADRLQLESVHPDRQEGFSIREQPGELIINTLFEGKLTIRIRFSAPG